VNESATHSGAKGEKMNARKRPPNKDTERI